MASQDYLIAIALIEQNDIRAMPLGGKEIKDKLEEKGNLNKLGEEVILNLLLRVFQRSDDGALKRVSENFYPIHLNINNTSSILRNSNLNIPHCLEVSYINKKYVKKFEFLRKKNHHLNKSNIKNNNLLEVPDEFFS